jgi:predicted ABC-type ATPase
MPNLYIIAGPNGAGKTTASYTVLPEMLKCKEFVNADEIAKGLSPFQSDKAAISAGRLMLQRIKSLINSKVDFAFETTLSTKSYVNTIQKAKDLNYTVTIVYFWLSSPELATERVKLRVREGGHDIPEETIRRRYQSGIKNLFQLYIPIANYWMIINNSVTPSHIVAEGSKKDKKQIADHIIWNQITQKANGK